jgi:hypothetical protein
VTGNRSPIIVVTVCPVMTVSVVPGRHDVVVRAQGAIDEIRSVDVDFDGSSLTLTVWRGHPIITYLKLPLPGAMLADAVFLDDGRLALQVALPDGERQAWTLDPDAHLASQRRRRQRQAHHGGAAHRRCRLSRRWPERDRSAT